MGSAAFDLSNLLVSFLFSLTSSLMFSRIFMWATADFLMLTSFSFIARVPYGVATMASSEFQAFSSSSSKDQESRLHRLPQS